MKVTLYNDCIFTNSYNEVCATWEIGNEETTVFHRYLDNLQKITFDIDYSYKSNSGYFTVPIVLYKNGFSASVFEFNYLKFSDSTKTIYCFIDNIEIKNNLYVIYYSEDYWHTYFNPDNFRVGRLTSVYQTNYENQHAIYWKELPVKPIVKEVSYGILNKDGWTAYRIFAQVQVYKGKRSGDTTYRTARSVILCEQTDDVSKLKYDFTYEDAVEMAQRVVENMSGKVTVGTDEDNYYNIDNITFIPKGYDPDNQLISNVETVPLEDGKNKALFYTDNILAIPITDGVKYGELYRTSVSPNYYRMGIGTLNHNFEPRETGTSYNLVLKYFVDNFDMKIIMMCQDKIIDITEDFVYDIPINSISGEANAQKRMARIMSNVNNVIKIGEGVAQIATEISTGLSTSLVPTNNSSFDDVLTGKSYINPYYMNYQSKNRFLVEQQGQANTYNATTGLGKIVQGSMGLYQNNASIYTSSSYISNTGLNSNTIFYGLIEIIPNTELDPESILDPIINHKYIENITKYTGFSTLEITENYIFYPLFVNDDKTFNIVKFDYVDLHESSQLITNKLKEILQNGVKIWYNEEAIFN